MPRITALMSPLKGTTHPPLSMYGTAWRSKETGSFTKAAILQGFRAIDTANHPSAYEEALTGDGIQATIKEGFQREDLFIQTKFTPLVGHHPDKIPWNPDQSIEGQIRESIEQSLRNLGVDYIDAVILHCPMPTREEDRIAWGVLESYVPRKIRQLGVSNIDLPTLEYIYSIADNKPAYVQNRLHGPTKYDVPLRRFCKEKGIIYQAFTMINCPELVNAGPTRALGEKLQIENEHALFVLVLGLGDTMVLNATRSESRMKIHIDLVKNLLENPEM